MANHDRHLHVDQYEIEQFRRALGRVDAINVLPTVLDDGHPANRLVQQVEGQTDLRSKTNRTSPDSALRRLLKSGNKKARLEAAEH